MNTDLILSSSGFDGTIPDLMKRVHDLESQLELLKQQFELLELRLAQKALYDDKLAPAIFDGICNACHKAGNLWAAQQAHNAGLPLRKHIDTFDDMKQRLKACINPTERL